MKKSFFFFIVLLHIGTISFAQKRQADSLRLKQLQYQQKMLQEAKQKQQEAESKAYIQSTTVVAYDSKGNKVESFKTKGGEKVTVITMPSSFNKPIDTDTINTDSISLKVIKSKFCLQVFYKGKLLKTYKSVFGPNHLLQKQQEGDRRTPEGTFTILNCKKHDKWDTFMLLDYPNDDSYANFERCKMNKEIPATARIGGLVGIHGIWKGGDQLIDMKHNWTDGCVALKNKDVEELSKIVKPGVTKITIVR